MEKQRIAWLTKELPKWKEKGWLTEKGEAEITQFYKKGGVTDNPSLFRLILIALAFGMIILGIFLLFAGYWYSFSPNGRFDWVLVLLVLSLAFVGGVIWKAPRFSAWSEGAALLFFISMLGGTFLVGETYYLGEDIGTYLLYSLGLFLPILYLLKSWIGLFCYLIGVIGWCLSADTMNFWGGAELSWVFLIAALPFYILYLRKDVEAYRQVSYLTWGYIIAVYTAFVVTVEAQQNTIGIILEGVIFSTTYLLSLMLSDKIMMTKALRWFGGIGILAVILKGSVTGTWLHVQQIVELGWFGVFVTILFLMGQAYVLNLVVKRKKYEGLVLGISPFMLALGSVFVRQGVSISTITVTFALYVLIVAMYLILRGVVEKKISLVNWGVVIVFLLMTARFLDPAFTFVERGITFLVAGGAILGANLVYMWYKLRQKRYQALKRKRVHSQIDLPLKNEQGEAISNEVNASSELLTQKEETKSKKISDDESQDTIKEGHHER